MDADIRGIAARTLSLSATADPTVVSRMSAVPAGTDDSRTSGSAVPQQSIPSSASALPVAETALRQVLATQGPSGAADPAATALDLLRSVEALLRASAPAGTSSEEIGAAAARLVERQGLLARLNEASSGAVPTTDAWQDPAPDAETPNAVDTRL